MTTTHQDHYWHAGDDWQINATLLDANGAPFDLTSEAVVIKWNLYSEAGVSVLDEGDASIVATDPEAGICAIHVPAVKTSPLAEGRYTDMIRIVSTGMTSTLNYGGVWVTVDPWQATV